MPPLPVSEDRRHQLPVRIKDASGERRARDGGSARPGALDIGIELPLHSVEQILIDDGRVHPRMCFVLVDDHPEVHAIAQEVEQRAATERLIADRPATGGDPLLRADALSVQRRPQFMNRAQLEVPLEDLAHEVGLGWVDDHGSGSGERQIVAERQVASHPHPLGL